MPVLLLAIAGAMAAEPWAGTRSWPTVNPTSSAIDDGFAKVCKADANNNKYCKKSC